MPTSPPSCTYPWSESYPSIVIEQFLILRKPAAYAPPMNCSSLTAASVSTHTSVTSVVILSRLPLPNPAIPPVPHILAESVSDTYVSLIIQSDMSLSSASPAIGAAKHGSVVVISILAPYISSPVTFAPVSTPKKPAPYVLYSFLLPS